MRRRRAARGTDLRYIARMRQHLTAALALQLCIAVPALAHGVRGYPIVVAPSPLQQLYELALSSAWAGNVSITVEGDSRVIRSDGLPDHDTGAFPNRGNPNRISAQRYDVRVPARPQLAARITALQMQSFGFAINGEPFDPGAAEFWNGDRNWQYEAMSGAVPLGLDQNNAHVQPNGAYHYHGLPTGLLAHFAGAKTPVLVGWAADGFPIYGPYGYSDANARNSPLTKLRASWRVKSGARNGGPGGNHDGSFVQDYEYVPGLGNLDECNGRSGVTPEFPAGTYYYVLTDSFPYIPRCFKGTPDASFARGRPAGGGADFAKGPPREAGKGPPPEALDACRGKRDGAACTFTGRRNEALSGSCFTPPDGGGQLACRPDRGGPPKN